MGSEDPEALDAVRVTGRVKWFDPGKGSGRSQPGMNLGKAIQAAWEAGVLLAGGGHAMAAGLTVKADDWNGRRGVQFEIEDVADPRMA